MKLKATQENLAKALNSVAKIANSRSTLPILSNVIIKTVGNRLSVAATNLDIAITHFIGSKVSSEGAITVPARLTQDFINSLPPGVIDLQLTDNKLHLTTDKFKSVINGTLADEFPVMPSINKGTKWSVDSKVLKTGLQQVIVAVSADEARPVLTGVFLHTHSGKLYAVATDSYRLAEKEITKSSQDISILVPGTAIHELLRILPDHEQEVLVIHDDQQVSFSTGDVQLVTRLIDGKYPDYRKLIPQKFATSATIKRAEFMNITKVSSLFARESAGSVTIAASQPDKQISIRSVASQLGENTASASGIIDGSGEITLNSRYLLDALNVLSSEEVAFSFNGKLEPSILRATDSKDYIHVIMPLKS